MAWTQQDYEALKEAVASGIRRVEFADRTVEYQTLSEMRKLLADMRAELFPPSAGRLTVATVRRGFGY